MEQLEKTCCAKTKSAPSKGILSSLLAGLIPHSFCLAFAFFSIIGAVTATTLLKKFLLIPNFFYFLVLVSLLLTTISSIIYLKRMNCLCLFGIKNKWKYITTLYTTTILVNLFMFFVIFPALANINSKNTNDQKNLADLSINVQIPCPGHATLIMDEIKKNSSVQSIKFELPNTFAIKYDAQKTSPEKIIASDVFKTYKVTIN